MTTPEHNAGDRESPHKVIDIRTILAELISSSVLPKDIREKMIAMGTADTLAWISKNPTLTADEFVSLVAFASSLQEADDQDVLRNADNTHRHLIASYLLTNNELPRELVAACVSLALEEYPGADIEKVLGDALSHPNLDPEVYAEFFHHALSGKFTNEDIISVVFTEEQKLALITSKSSYLPYIMSSNLLFGHVQEDVKSLMEQNFESAYYGVVYNENAAGWALEHLFNLTVSPHTGRPQDFTNGVNFIDLLNHPKLSHAKKIFTDTNYGSYRDADYLSRGDDSGYGNSYEYPLRDLSTEAAIAVTAINTPQDVLFSIIGSGQDDAVYELIHAPVERDIQTLELIATTYADNADIMACVVAHHNVTQDLLAMIAQRTTARIMDGISFGGEDINRLIHHLVLHPLSPQDDVDSLEEALTARNITYPGFEYRRNGYTVEGELSFHPSLYEYERNIETIGAPEPLVQNIVYRLGQKWLTIFDQRPFTQQFAIDDVIGDILSNKNVTKDDWQEIADLIGLS